MKISVDLLDIWKKIKFHIHYFGRKLMDYCTLFPDGNYGDCCKRHDRRYENRRISKWQADKLLRRCVKRKKNVILASIMWLGVTIFGLPWYLIAQYKNNR